MLRIKYTKEEVAARLRKLADEMEEVGAAIDYVGGMAEWAYHGSEMVGAAEIARQWAEEIEANK